MTLTLMTMMIMTLMTMMATIMMMTLMTMSPSHNGIGRISFPIRLPSTSSQAGPAQGDLRLLFVVKVILRTLKIILFTQQPTQRHGCVRCQGGDCRCRLLPHPGGQDWRAAGERRRLPRETLSSPMRRAAGEWERSNQVGGWEREVGGWERGSPAATSPFSSQAASGSSGSGSRCQQAPIKPRRSPARPPATR